MSMTVKLYSYQDDKIIANKSGKLNYIADAVCDIVGEFNILSPTIRLNTATSSLNANYVYIQELDLYYFVVDRQGLKANHIDLVLKEDLRYNYYNAVRSSQVTATRSNFYNKNIPDTMALNVPQERIQYRKLSSALTGQTYIVIIGG